MANEVKAGEAYVEITARDQAAQKQIERFASRLGAVGGSLESVGNKLLTTGAALAVPLLGAAKAYADAGSALVDMSDRTGVAIEQLSTLKFAAEQSGASFEALESGLKFMQKNIAAAFGGDSGAVEKLDRLGVSLDSLRGLAPDAQFRLLADAVASISDPAARTAAAMELFGRGGAALLPLLKEGATGIEELQAKAEALGLKMSTETAKAAEEFGDRLDAVKMQVGALANIVGAALLPQLSELLNGIQPTLQAAAGWIAANAELVQSLAAVVAGLLAAGVACRAAGVVLTTVSAAMRVLSASAVAARVAVTALNLAAATGPLGALAVAVGVAAAAWASYADAADRAAGSTAAGAAAAQFASDGISERYKPQKYEFSLGYWKRKLGYGSPPPAEDAAPAKPVAAAKRDPSKEAPDVVPLDAAAWERQQAAAAKLLARSAAGRGNLAAAVSDEVAQSRTITANASGTFNASAAFALAAANPVSQLLDEAEKQRKELEDLNRKADRARLVFGA